MIWRLIIFIIYNLYILGIEWGAAIVGQRYKRPAWPRSYKWLVVLCWVTGVVETASLGALLMRVQFSVVHNIWGYVETGTIVFIQLRELTHAVTRRLQWIILVVLTVGTGIYFIRGPLLSGMNLSFLLFTLFIQLIAACIVIIDILISTSDRPPFVQPAFWLAIGMLFFSAIFSVIYIMEKFIIGEVRVVPYFLAFSTVANTFMYGGIIACFITLRREGTSKVSR
jgi:hypothetical protein